jgi:hypothetical protein
MNDLRKVFLSDTRLAGDQNAQIGFGYLHGYLDAAIQKRTLTDDPESLFNG